MLNVFNTANSLSGINAKMDYLREAAKLNPMLKEVIRYAYDPYKNFYLRQFPLRDTGSRDIGQDTFDVLDLFNDRVVTGDRLKSQYVAYTSKLNKEAQVLFNKILRRDLRIGLNIKSFNKIWPGLIPVYDVMLAQKVDWSRIMFPCWSSVKIDGVRAIYENHNFVTRSGKQIMGLGHIIDQLGDAPQLDGELFIPGSGFDYSCGNIRSLHASPDAVFGMFDIPDAKISFKERLEQLKQYRTGNTRIVKHVLVRSVEEALAFNDKCWKAGFEGTVLKPYDYEYERKRSFDWMKIKENHTEDWPCVGFYKGTGRNSNRLGGIIINRKGVEVRVGGGFSDEQREEIWKNQMNYFHMTAEGNFQEVTKDGSLRHPNFVRWRPDK